MRELGVGLLDLVLRQLGDLLLPRRVLLAREVRVGRQREAVRRVGLRKVQELLGARHAVEARQRRAMRDLVLRRAGVALRLLLCQPRPRVRGANPATAAGTNKAIARATAASLEP